MLTFVFVETDSVRAGIGAGMDDAVHNVRTGSLAARLQWMVGNMRLATIMSLVKLVCGRTCSFLNSS